MTRIRLSLVTLIVLLGIIAASNALILYWVWSAPQKVLEISPQPIPVSTKVAKPGEYIILNYNFCKTSPATGRIVTTLVGDKVQLTLPAANEREDKICKENVKVPLPVPDLATPGEYHFHFRVTYMTNPLRSVSQDFDTQNFKVIN